MESTILSESLMESNASSKTLRDPFEQARNSYESKKLTSADSTVLSSSPFSPEPSASVSQNLGQTIQPDFGSMLKGIGIDAKGISFDEVGKINLLGRLKKKFGDQYAQNPQAMEALKAFEGSMETQSPEDIKAMNKTLSNAQRTIGALFGGA